ncbi:MAG: YraN family protein [Xanthomonadales bacterium]|nr:YraN family protein [Xanthomonadales bacterium]
MGNEWELQAENWLQQRGLTTLQLNFNCRGGEIDLIMRDGESLVFVEVRYRKNAHFGSAAESVTMAKQQRLIFAAEFFLQANPALAELPCRFDVIAIDSNNNTNAVEYNWIKNAFDLS